MTVDLKSYGSKAFAASQYQRERDYWLGRMEGFAGKTVIPYDFNNPVDGNPKLDSVPIVFPSLLSEKLSAASAGMDHRLLAILLAALTALLHRYLGTDEATVAVPVPRQTSGGELLNSVLVLRNRAPGDCTFRQLLLNEVRRNLVESEKHQNYPLEILARQLSVPDAHIGSPLFDIALLLEPLHDASYIDGRRVNVLFAFTNGSSGLSGLLHFNRALYRKQRMEETALHFLTLLGHAIDEMGAPISSLPLLTFRERKRLLVDFNKTATDYPRRHTVHRLFREVAHRLPDAVAVTFQRDSLTYRELEHRSRILAFYLSGCGVNEGDIVGIEARHSCEIIVGLLGILQAGAAYLAINPALPRDRKQFLADDSGLDVLLDAAAIVAATHDGRRGVDVPLAAAGNPMALAYVMYTSGSTGRPKGVMVRHRSVARLVRDTDYIQFAPSDRILQTGALDFDASTFEIWGALLNGLGLFLLGKDSLLHVEQLNRAIRQFDISIMWMTSPLFNQMVECEPSIFSSLRYLLVGGDVLSPRHISRVRGLFPRLSIINGYGPTENTTFSTAFAIDRDYDGNIPIGRPIANSTVYIVDAAGQPAPVGIPGECWVGGDGVAAGYLNNPQLTAQRFGDNYFTGEGLVFKTGDYARWLPDGTVEFIGRVDNQVKIRGFRIETGEIANCLLSIESVKGAVVAVKGHGSEKYLCAYFVADGDLDGKTLRRRLSELLPPHMIPGSFVRMPEFPLNLNGKIDMDALPEPGMGEGEAYVAPRNSLEKDLAGIWAGVLAIPVGQVSIDANFFEIGGHSLKATILSANIQKNLGLAITLEHIFEFPTIREMAEFLEGSVTSDSRQLRVEEERDVYPVAPAQTRLLILERLEGAGAYNVPLALHIEGRIEPELFKRTLERLMRRHDLLRASFHVNGDRPLMKIHRDVAVPFVFHTCSAAGVEARVKDFIRPFRIDRAPLFRVELLQTGDNSYVLAADFHHLIMDGTSQQIFVKEFLRLYNGEELPDLEFQYRDFALFQQQAAGDGVLREQQAFWLNQLSPSPQPLELPRDFPRPPLQRYEGARYSFTLDPGLVEGFKHLAANENATLFMVLLALYNLFLAKITGQDDLAVGTPVAGRRIAGLNHVLGMFVNTLTLRNQIQDIHSFRECVRHVKHRALQAFDNQDVPFEEVVEALDLPRDTSRNPLFDVMFSFHNQWDLEGEAGLVHREFTVKPYPFRYDISKFDLTLVGEERDDCLRFSFEYSVHLFEHDTIRRLAGYFDTLARSAAAEPDAPCHSLRYLTASEKEEILQSFNQTVAGRPVETAIHHVLENRSFADPDAVAAVEVETGAGLTYRQLRLDARRLAVILRSRGIGPGSIAGISLERSLDLLKGILGVLAAGAAYLPVEPSLPSQRLETMIARSGATEPCVVAECLELLETTDAGDGENNAEGVGSHNSPAYILYTSGSTGEPKGVMVEHGQVLNLLMSMQRRFPCNSGDAYLLKTSCMFDVSVTELFGWMPGGGRCVISVPSSQRDPRHLLRQSIRHRITHINFVPSMFNAWLDVLQSEPTLYFAHCKYIMLAGEAVSPGQVERYRRLGMSAQLENLYGPTEATVYAAGYSLAHWTPGRRVPIGKPLDNIRLYVLDRHLQPVGIGVKGHLYIAGNGLARGYLDNPTLTKEVYVSAPFAPYERLYASGDLARWNNDGELEFFGRSDRQVKVRGNRVETGEVEHHLALHHSVAEAVVIALEDVAGSTCLCGYVTAKDKKTVDLEEVKDFLRSRLPSYMVPDYLLAVDQVPRTSSGKIDRSALPSPFEALPEAHVRPGDDWQSRLAILWAEALAIPLEAVDVRRRFFDSGGHSLKANLLVNLIHREFGVRLPLIQIFKTQTVAELAPVIAASVPTGFSLRAYEVQDYYSLTSGQKRLLVLQEMEPSATVYNMPFVVRLLGAVDRLRLERAMARLVHRHDSLRTSFHMMGEDAIQRVARHVDFYVEYFDVRDSVDSEAAAVEVVKQFVRPFNPAVAPLIRAGLIQVDENDVLLMVDMHHMVGDGQSHAVLLREFAVLYNGGELPELELQYRDYAQWLAGEAGLRHIKKQEEFWLREFAEPAPVLDLPLDFSRPPMQSFDGSMETVVLGPELTEAIRRLARQRGGTVFMTVLALFYVLLCKLSSQEDIVVGTPVLGRRRPDLEAIIGMFVNTLPLRDFPVGDKSFSQFLDEVKGHTLSAFENQECPFEDLVDKVTAARDISRNPLFDVMFSFYTAEASVENNRSPIPGVTVVPFQLESATSKFDLSLYAEENEDRIACSFEYCTRLFSAATVRRFAAYFMNIAVSAVKDPGQNISNLEWLPLEEKELILELFNRTAVQHPDGTSIQRFFLDAAGAHPARTALRFGDATVSYGCLRRRSLCMARQLKAMGCGSASLVGIMMDRCLEMIVAILAVLSAGGAYVPIDPSIPEERKRYILKDSALGVLLEKEAIMENSGLDFPEEADRQFNEASAPTDPSYCIYTSGSTGRPKGVLVEHRSVVNILQTLQVRYPLGEDDCYLLKTPVVFDVSVTELFGWFIGGGALCILPPGDEKDPDAIVQAIGRYRVSHINFVPSMFSAFLEMMDQAAVAELSSLRYCFLAGEALPASTVKAFRASGIGARLENIYGPTEATVYAAGYSLEDWTGGDVPIGKPLDNMRIRILDRYGRLRGITMNGELFIAGTGLARGYLNRVELTHEAFGVDCSADGERLYRSGDLARWRPDGHIEYLGRVDHQVKIRGNRIELGEIESALLEHPAVFEVVAAAIEEETGNKCLAAYVRGFPDEGGSELEEYLRRRLPSYMIPAYFVAMEEFPRNAAGKIDRLRLPPATEMKRAISGETVEPATPLEKVLAEAWGDVLGRDSIGVTDNFFALGGDSIKTIQIAGRVRSKGYRMAMADIFRNPTIRQLALTVKEISRVPSQKPVIGPCPLTPIQSQFFQSGREELHYYNQAVMLRSERRLGEEMVHAVFEALQNHHDALRMTFHREEGRIVQFCRGPGMPVSLEVFDFTGLPEAGEKVTTAAAGIQGKIDLENGPLMRLGLFRLDDGDRLLVAVHHLVIDGVSWRILFEDIDALSRQFQKGQSLELPLKSDSFKYWGEALARYAGTESFKSEVPYWRGLESRDVGVIRRDVEAGPNLVADGALATMSLSAEETALLLAPAHEAFNTEIEDILVTALGLAIRESFGCPRVLLALEGHGREEVLDDVDVARTVGWFTSLYPVALDLGESSDPGICVKTVKETLRAIPRKGIGYGVLRYLAPAELREGMEFVLRPQVIFNYLGQFDADVRKMTELGIAAESPGPVASPDGVRLYDLDLSGMISGECLSVTVSYNRTHFRQATVEGFLSGYMDWLRRIIRFCTERDQKELTPSDLTYKGLSLDALQEIDNMFG